MGLDMYLYAERYTSGYNHSNDAERDAYNVITKNAELADYISGQTDSPSATVRATVLYWRKANEIHAWFVNNCGGGKDECQEMYVEPSKLRDLVARCRAAIHAYDAGKHEECANLLPTQAGFFFGGTDYDQWYRESLERTANELERILSVYDAEKAARDAAHQPANKLYPPDFYYRASW